MGLPENQKKCARPRDEQNEDFTPTVRWLGLGSKFEVDGTYIKGPALRSLDRFVVKAVDDQGNELVTTDTEGYPVPVPPDARLLVDTGQRILGKPKGQAYPGHVDRGKHSGA